MTAIDAQAAPMGGQLFDIPDTQVGGFEDPFNRVEREIGKVLVVDGVELGVFDELQQVGEFQRNGAVGLEDSFEAASEVVDVGHVGIDVVASNQVGLPAFCGQAFAKGFAKELAQDGYAQLFGGDGSAGSGLNAQAGNAGGDKVFEQVAVVGGDFDDVAVIVESQLIDHLCRIARGMGQPTGRGAGEVGVVGTEKFVGLGIVFGLHQPAMGADFDIERVIFFRVLQVLR